MAVDIGPKIGIDGEAEYRKKINEIISQAKTLSSEMKKLESSFDNEGKSIKENNEKKKLLNEQIKTQEERVKALKEMLEKSKDAYGENSTQTDKWRQAVNNAETDLNNLKKTLSDMPNSLQLVGDKMKSVGDSMKSVGDSISSAGRGMTTKVTAPIVAGFTSCVKTTMDFDAEMSKVAAISGATGSDFDALREKAIEMGNSTKFSATESAEAMEYMAMAGWKTDDIMGGLAGVMNLAAASGEELGTTSDIVTDALTAFGYSAEDANHFADILAATSANANTNVGMLGESFKYAAAPAGALGYSAEDVSLALGLMANSGIKADMAGTSLRNMFTRMAKPTKESDAAMQRLGLTLADDEGNMYSFREIMDQMRQSFTEINMPLDEYNAKLDELDAALEDGTLSESNYNKELDELNKQAFGAEGAEKARAAAMLGGTRAMSAMLAITEASEEDYQKLATAIDGSSESMALLADGSIVPLSEALASGQEIIEQYDGAAQQMAATMADNASGDLQILKSNMEALAISIGDLLTPALRDIISSAQEFVQKLTAMDDGTKQTIVKIGLAVAAIGPALIIIGKIVGAIGTIISVGGSLTTAIGAFSGWITATAIPAISGMAASATAAIPGIVAFMAPFLPFVAIGAAVVAAGVLIYKNWDTIKETAQKLGAAISEKWESIKSKTSEAWGNIKSKTSEMWNNAKTTITEAANNIKQNVSEKWENIKSKTSETWNNVKTKATDVLKGMLSDTKSNLSNMKQAFESNGGGIKGTAAAMWEGVKGYYKTGFNALNTLTNGKLKEIADLFGGLKDKALTWGKDMIGNFIQGIKDKLAEWKETLNGLAQDAANVLKHSHPKQGPMADDNTWMPDMMILFAKGIRENAHLINDAIDDVATDISVGVNGYSAQQADGANFATAIMGAIDPAAIYNAVREGASDAEITIDIDGRDLRRNLDALGVQFT